MKSAIRSSLVAVLCVLAACGEGLTEEELAGEIETDEVELSSTVAIDGELWFAGTQVHTLNARNARGAYTFVGARGTSITGTLLGRDPKDADTVLSLYQQTSRGGWSLKATNDNASKAVRSSSLTFTLPADGTYLLYTRVKGLKEATVAVTLDCAAGSCGQICPLLRAMIPYCPGRLLENRDEHGCAGLPTCDNSCGGLTGLSCQPGNYCDFGPTCGAADELGTCKQQPELCTKEYFPVCGCDGNTYGNACMAAAAGVSVVSKGACAPQCPSYAKPECEGGNVIAGEIGPDGCPGAPICSRVCGTRGAMECNDGWWCKREESAMCGRADAPGTCTPPSGPFCTKIYQPVCGCDGKTYGNPCEAAAAQVSVDYQGVCTCASTGTFQSLKADDVIGTWSGKADWTIGWEFGADGTVTKTDEVSPCPADAQCIWSGIVTNQGTWKLLFGKVYLTWTSSNTTMSVSLPKTLTGQTNVCGGINLVETTATPDIEYSRR